MKDQRSGEILDAYLTCVAKYGLEGATQERIAKVAGVKRPLLRHYLGNREQMISAFCDHVLAGFAQTTETLRQALEPNGRAIDLVEILFSGDHKNDPRLMLAYQALVASVSGNPNMRQPLLDSLQRFVDVIEAVLLRNAPSATPDRVRAVAQGIAAAYVNLDALSPLQPPDAWRSELKQAAVILANSLETAR